MSLVKVYLNQKWRVAGCGAIFSVRLAASEPAGLFLRQPHRDAD